jgi:hypothetical protein
MAPSFALNIGTDRTTGGYGGAVGPAFGCDAAAEALETWAKGLNYEIVPRLINEHATKDNVIAAFEGVAQKLEKDSIFLFSVAGHGRVLSGPGKGCEPRDQALMLYDRYLVDNRIYDLCASIRVQAHVIIVATGCYSGGFHILPRSLTRATAYAMPRSSSLLAEPCPSRPQPEANVLLLASSSPTALTGAQMKGGVPLFVRHLIDCQPMATSFNDLCERIKAAEPSIGGNCIVDARLVRKDSFLLEERTPFALP